MSSYSELVKSFEKIRAYMREFYVYGFKSREEYSAKSARSTIERINANATAQKNSLKPEWTLGCFWRRVWDSNPRACEGKRFSRPPRYDRFDNPPYI